MTRPIRVPREVGRVLPAAFWSTGTYYGTRVLSLVATAVLARLLTPEQFGLVGYAFVVMTFMDVLRDLGMGPAVIYVHDEDAAHTAFWTGLVASIAGYAIVWSIAPYVGELFHEPQAATIVRVLGLSLPLAALGNIHDNLLARQLAFRTRSVPDFSISATRALASVAGAVLGMGAWSLVAGHLAGIAAGVVVLWLMNPWRPTASYSRPHARKLLRYGGATLSLNAVAKLLVNADYLFIGRYLGANALGLYTLAFRVPELLIGDFCTAIGRVVFPAYARRRDQAEEVAKGVLLMMRYVALVMLPIGVGLACAAEPFVLVVLGDQWASAVDVTRAIAIQSVLLALTYNIGDVYKATGHLSLLTKIALARSAVLLPALWYAAARVGTIEAVAYTHAIVAFALLLLDLVIASLTLGVTLRALVGSLVPALSGTAALAAVVVVVLVRTEAWSDPMQLAAAVTVGALTYLTVLVIFYRSVVLAATDLVRRSRQRVATP